jgi:nickel-dependent lactate racemase
MQLLKDENAEGLKDSKIIKLCLKSLEGRQLNKVLLIPPDITRYYSNAGYITRFYYRHLTSLGTHVDILPALGTHAPMTKAELDDMYSGIPYERFITHNWRTDTVRLGEVPADYLHDITGGIWNEPVACEINRLVMDARYDLILSIGQVVPHEVIGMSNHAKNLFVGAGGSEMINKSHMIGALYGMERLLGRDHSPVRKLMDYCLERFLKDRPILYVLTVTTAPQGEIKTHGLFIGEGRVPLEEAVKLSQKVNIDFLDRGIKKCVVYLDPKEFKSTWLGNKAVYRTRMAIEDGGELIVLAPGVSRFGEDDEVDRIIRRYGYCGRERMIELYREKDDLRCNMGAAAHLIHGSSDGRFKITYAVKKIMGQEIAGVQYNPAGYDEMVQRYDPGRLSCGWNTLTGGEEIFFIPNPALGLWIDKNKF